MTNREIDVHGIIGEADDYIERRMIEDALKKIPLGTNKRQPKSWASAGKDWQRS